MPPASHRWIVLEALGGPIYSDPCAHRHRSKGWQFRVDSRWQNGLESRREDSLPRGHASCRDETLHIGLARLPYTRSLLHLLPPQMGVGRGKLPWVLQRPRLLRRLRLLRRQGVRAVFTAFPGWSYSTFYLIAWNTSSMLTRRSTRLLSRGRYCGPSP